MGTDKAALPFGADTLLTRVASLAARAAVETIVAAGPTQVVPPGWLVSRDRQPGAGPLPALLGALGLVTQNLVLVLAVDMPLFEPALAGRLAAICEGWDGAVPLVAGTLVPTCAVYRTRALRERSAAFGDPRHRSLRAFLNGLRIRVVSADLLRDADPALRTFTPCNTPEQYRDALRLAGLPVNDGFTPAV
jgi:molybdopterin-guanine dinucleotide biosynthesis protein A